MTTKRIGVFTGSRSEYGLLVPVMRAIEAHPNGDIGSKTIIAALEAFKTAHPATILRPTLGRRLYHGVLNMIGTGQGV